MIDKTSYRAAMARLGAAVNIITTTDGSHRRGITASSVCSVTDDPPTLLLCVNRDSDANDAFKSNGVLCVNTLSASQEHLSPIFASMTGASQEDRFGEAVWSTLATGSPVLQGAVVSFDCKIAQSTEVGTHTVFFCEVQALQFGEQAHGLIYFDRAYHRIIVAPA